MVKNNSINNEEISSAKNLNHQDLSEEIKIEKEQSYDVWNRDNTLSQWTPKKEAHCKYI